MPAGIKTIAISVIDEKHAEMAEEAKAYGSFRAYFEALHRGHMKRKNSKAKK